MRCASSPDRPTTAPLTAIPCTFGFRFARYHTGARAPCACAAAHECVDHATRAVTSVAAARREGCSQGNLCEPSTFVGKNASCAGPVGAAAKTCSAPTGELPQAVPMILLSAARTRRTLVSFLER